ncbi:MAG: DUF924 family protein [Pseudohongiellaceae bacterium]
MTDDDVLQFWFEESQPSQWFIRDHAFDREISTRFATLHEAAREGELYTWREEASGALAEIIVLDQFPRNMFRGSPKAFATDTLALILAQEAVRRKLDKSLNTTQKAFLYMPFMHSESPLIHQVAEYLFNQPGLEENYNFEIKHKAIIDRFGRYPHRNEILGRQSTAQELEFLKQPGSSF